MHTLNDISEMKTNLVESLNYEMRCCGTDNMDICKTGQVVDMIKDLASAEKDCMEKCYYESIVEAMHEGGDYDHEERMGYNNRRYSSGRYAPAGKGHYAPGYTPMHPHMPMMDHDDFMGYPRNITGNTSNPRMGYPMDYDKDDKYGDAYKEFDKSRRHYHESKGENDKMMMEHHADQHIKDIEASVKDIWNESSPEMKKKIKSDMSKLLAEMAV